MAKFLTIHGPNLNKLSEREPAIYGETSLATIDQRLEKLALQQGHQMTCVQHNAEHALLERIHAASGEAISVIIINPAALGHTSIALRDALLSVTIPFIEVHLSNIYAREPFRHHSFLSDKAIGVITGFGALSYELALRAAIHYVE